MDKNTLLAFLCGCVTVVPMAALVLLHWGDVVWHAVSERRRMMEIQAGLAPKEPHEEPTSDPATTAGLEGRDAGDNSGTAVRQGLHDPTTPPRSD